MREIYSTINASIAESRTLLVESDLDEATRAALRADAGRIRVLARTMLGDHDRAWELLAALRRRGILDGRFEFDDPMAARLGTMSFEGARGRSPGHHRSPARQAFRMGPPRAAVHREVPGGLPAADRRLLARIHQQPDDRPRDQDPAPPRARPPSGRPRPVSARGTSPRG